MGDQIVSGALGMQYKFAPHFFDQRGALIEAALSVFNQAEDVEIALGTSSPGLSPDEILLRGEDITITINPVKAVLQYGRFDSLENFKSIVEKFINLMKSFYDKNQLEFVGVVYRVQGPLDSRKSLGEVFPIFKESFLEESGPVTGGRITYLRGDHRIHLTFNLDLVAKKWQLDFDTQKIRSASLDEAPLLVDKCQELLQDFLGRNKLPEGEK